MTHCIKNMMNTTNSQQLVRVARNLDQVILGYVGVPLTYVPTAKQTQTTLFGNLRYVDVAQGLSIKFQDDDIKYLGYFKS